MGLSGSQLNAIKLSVDRNPIFSKSLIFFDTDARYIEHRHNLSIGVQG